MFVKVKRVFALLLALTMLFALVQPVSAAANEPAGLRTQLEAMRKAVTDGSHQEKSQEELLAEYEKLVEKFQQNKKSEPKKSLSDDAYSDADKVFEAIEALEDGYAKRNLSQTKLTDAAAELVEASDSYVEDSLIRNGNSFTWWTDSGIRCVYSPRMQEIQENLTPEKGEDAIINEPKAVKGGSPSGNQVYLIGPYYGYDDSFKDQYKQEAAMIADAIGDTSGYTLYSGKAATVDKVAEAVSNGAVVIFDSHGMTDYENPYNELDFVTGATNSYLCLTSTTGLTSADYAAGAVYDSDGIWINGATIANHMTKNSPSGLVWMAMCLGMATDTLCEPLRQKGVEVVYGYSQSVTFSADYLFAEVFWNQMCMGDTVSAAMSTLKATWGDWELSAKMAEHYLFDGVATTISQARDYYYAFPVVVSDEDAHPGQRTRYSYGADSIQKVNSTYTLGETDFTYQPDTPGQNVNYYQEVLNYINTHGIRDDDGIPTLIDWLVDGATTYYFTMQNVYGEIVMTFLSASEDATSINIMMDVSIPANDSKFYVDFMLLYYYGGELIDLLEEDGSDYRSEFTMDTEYVIAGSYYVDSYYASSFFNLSLQTLIATWDYALYYDLGFGMKCLGFTSYEGYGDPPYCNHSYSNTCDASCNNCGAVRPVEHTASNSCDTVCNICGALLLANHIYSNGVCQVCQAKDPDYNPAILGDITGDTEVNNEDVALLLWHTLFPEDYPLTANGDITKDGEVNNEDVALLLWHTLFPEDYPLK